MVEQVQQNASEQLEFTHENAEVQSLVREALAKLREEYNPQLEKKQLEIKSLERQIRKAQNQLDDHDRQILKQFEDSAASTNGAASSVENVGNVQSSPAATKTPKMRFGMPVKQKASPAPQPISSQQMLMQQQMLIQQQMLVQQQQAQMQQRLSQDMSDAGFFPTDSSSNHFPADETTNRLDNSSGGRATANNSQNPAISMIDEFREMGLQPSTNTPVMGSVSMGAAGIIGANDFDVLAGGSGENAAGAEMDFDSVPANLPEGAAQGDMGLETSIGAGMGEGGADAGNTGGGDGWISWGEGGGGGENVGVDNASGKKPKGKKDGKKDKKTKKKKTKAGADTAQADEAAEVDFSYLAASPSAVAVKSNDISYMAKEMLAAEESQKKARQEKEKDKGIAKGKGKGKGKSKAKAAAPKKSEKKKKRPDPSSSEGSSEESSDESSSDESSGSSDSSDSDCDSDYDYDSEDSESESESESESDDDPDDEPKKKGKPKTKKAKKKPKSKTKS